MKRTKWQFSLFFFVLSSLFILIANVTAAPTDKDTQSVNNTDGKTTHQTTQCTSTSLPAKRKKTIRNCSLATVQRKRVSRSKSLSKKLPNFKTVYVCHKTKKHSTSTKHYKHGSKKGANKKTSKKTTKKSRHTKAKSTTKSTTTIKKHTTTKKHTTKKKHTTTKKHTISKKHTTTKKHTSTKKLTTTKAKAISTTTKTHQFGETTTSSIVATAVQTTSPGSNNNSGTNYDDQSSYNSNEDNYTTVDDEDDSASLQAAPIPDITASPTPSGDSNASTDNNNQVSVQNIENGAAIEAKPQSTVIGVSVGAVVGCLAAAGLAGMFIYRRKQKSAHDQDVEDLNQTSEVNTRWRTQSFMAVVAGAVAKLPSRSNSSGSTRSIGVLGSIRRAASNASRSLSRSASRSSTQSYGIAVSGPIPAIARIDGDQAQYYAEPTSPTGGNGHHTHAY